MEKRGSAWKFGQVCDLPTFPHLAPPSPQAPPCGPDALCLPHRYISIPASPCRSLRWQSYRQALDHWPMNEQVQRRHSNQGFCLAQCPVEPGVPFTFFKRNDHTLVLHVVWPLIDSALVHLNISVWSSIRNHASNRHEIAQPPSAA